MAAPPESQFWTFDVSSLIVLVGEDEERNYRLSQRTFLQCLATAPVVGLQNYIRSYDLLLETSTETYFSPYGVKNAPLRNMQLANAMRHNKLLEDQRYTVYRVPPTNTSIKPASKRCEVLLAVWTIATWILFAGLLVAICLVPGTTWVSIATCTLFTAWSVILRLVEHFNVVPATSTRDNINNPDGQDAVYILGRSNSAFVLEGSRKDVKDITSRGLTYRCNPLGIPSSVWHAFTRVGSLVVLLAIFSAVPNGSTLDQVAFILLNVVAQLNVLIGQRLNSQCVLSRLEKVEDTKEDTRTHIYAKLIRRFQAAEEDNSWVEASGLLPRTEVWDTWKHKVALNAEEDPKILYQAIAKDLEFARRPQVLPQKRNTLEKRLLG